MTDLRLRQIAVVTRDTTVVEADLIGILGLTVSSRFEGVDQYGLGTVFLPVGNEFFEVVLAAEAGSAADRFIDRRGEGGFIVMLECRDLPTARARLEDRACRIVDAGDSPGLGRYLQVHPKDTGGTYLQIVEPYGPGVGEADGPWLYGGPDWRGARRTELVTGIVAAEIQTDRNPAELAELWADLLGAPGGSDAEGRPRVELERGNVRFVAATDDRGPGLGAFDVTAVAPDEIRRRARSRGCIDENGAIVIGGLRLFPVGDSEASRRG